MNKNGGIKYIKITDKTDRKKRTNRKKGTNGTKITNITNRKKGTNGTNIINIKNRSNRTNRTNRKNKFNINKIIKKTRTRKYKKKDPNIFITKKIGNNFDQLKQDFMDPRFGLSLFPDKKSYGDCGHAVLTALIKSHNLIRILNSNLDDNLDDNLTTTTYYKNFLAELFEVPDSMEYDEKFFTQSGIPYDYIDFIFEVIQYFNLKYNFSYNDFSKLKLFYLDPWYTLSNLQNIVILIQKIVNILLEKNTFMGFVFFKEQNYGHYTIIAKNNNGDIIIYEVQPKQFCEDAGNCGNEISLEKFITNFVESTDEKFGFGFIISQEEADYLNKYYLNKHYNPNLVLYNSIKAKGKKRIKTRKKNKPRK